MSTNTLAAPAITLSDVVVARIKALSSEVQGLFNTGASCRVWNGSRPLVNPTTKAVTGERVTVNMDIEVPQALATSVNKAIEAIKNSGQYIEIHPEGIKMVCIATRYDENNNRYILQFAPPNTSSTVLSNSPEFKSKLADAFSNAKVTANHTATTKVTAPAASDEVGF
jgi:hypothetical protein